MFKFDPRVSLGNILTLLIIAGSILTAIGDFNTRLTVVTAAQARAETTVREYYATIMQDIRELRVELRAIREALESSKGR